MADPINGQSILNRFGVSGFYSAEAFYQGGIREDLYSRFIRFEIGKKFDISVDEWFDSPYPEAMKKLEIAEKIYEVELERKKELNKQK